MDNQIQNQNQQEELESQDSKKTWVEPEMGELNLNKIFTAGENAVSGSKKS